MPKHATLGADGKVPGDKLPTGNGSVASVFGRAGAIAAQEVDYSTYYAPAIHYHGYAPLVHSHDYAPVIHTHDYAATSHNHDYAASNHNHDAAYAGIGHNHNAAYSALGHNHSGVYQPVATVLTNTTASFTTAQETKLAGIATGATANATDAQLRDRATHTGSSYHFVGTLANPQATGANVTPVNLTGLVFSYVANSIYIFRWIGTVTPVAATTGCGFQMDLSTAVTQIAMQFYHQLASTGTSSGGHSIADDASVGVSSGLPGTGVYPVHGQGILRTGANAGTAQLRFRSETTAVITANAGMTLVVEKVA